MRARYGPAILAARSDVGRRNLLDWERTELVKKQPRRSIGNDCCPALTSYPMLDSTCCNGDELHSSTNYTKPTAPR
jgi:hypothetical protein